MTHDTELSPMGGWTRLTTRDGAAIRVEVEHPSLSVVVEARGSVSLPYPQAGYGGHELLLSAEETYLAMWLYSGQGEVGYELFQLRPSLVHLGGMPYVRGVGVGPAFSRDERLLALAWATNRGLHIEDEELDDDGRTVAECAVEWATVRVQELPSGPASTCRISALVPAGFPFEGDDSYYPLRLEVDDGRVRLHAEWGVTIETTLPLPNALTIPGPLRRAEA